MGLRYSTVKHKSLSVFKLYSKRPHCFRQNKMDLENCQDKDRERRQKTPFQESDSDSLLKAGESGLSEEHRYVVVPGCP